MRGKKQRATETSRKPGEAEALTEREIAFGKKSMQC